MKAHMQVRCNRFSHSGQGLFWRDMFHIIRLMILRFGICFLACTLTICGAAPEANRHWAFIKPTRPALPQVRNANWPRNPIDYFVLARLEKEGIAPSPEASRDTLARRLYLDLVGLPPSPSEMEFSYEELVECLLASPHHGERWARWWLDVARYADSNGYSIDAPREIWKYRDWVIDAVNRDLPFDRFALEQLAGDLLPDATQANRVATGFHRNTQINQEGGV